MYSFFWKLVAIDQINWILEWIYAKLWMTNKTIVWYFIAIFDRKHLNTFVTRQVDSSHSNTIAEKSTNPKTLYMTQTKKIFCVVLCNRQAVISDFTIITVGSVGSSSCAQGSRHTKSGTPSVFLMLVSCHNLLRLSSNLKLKLFLF